MRELEDLTGVNREAIRFYIREGLLPEPEKPKRNVALYTSEHVERTRLIKELQEKHFLPLKKVKQVLASNDARAIAQDEQAPGMSHFLPALLRDTTPGPDCSIEEAAEQAGLPISEVENLIANGTITPSPDGMIDFRDAAILNTWGQAHRSGFDQALGYDADYLAEYAAMTRKLAKFELDLFISRFQDALDGRAAGQLAAEGVEVANKLINLLHTKYVLEEINKRGA